MLELESKEFGLKLTEKMSQMAMDEWNDFCILAIKEFTNIFSGRSLIGLESQELDCDISTPTLRVGEFNTDLEFALVRVPFKTDIGSFSLLVSVSENKSAKYYNSGEGCEAKNLLK